MKVELRAPMAGVFYRRPAPEEPVYVDLGHQVEKKQVLGLLETMKVFQPLKSPAAGTIVGIAAANEAPVTDGDLLFVIETGS
jgi:acetyl-CoA carboxylase biotin carboxyl carrier protein